jgi:endonuclease/exonuclease/phosphatase family metal-dependent hydrolase
MAVAVVAAAITWGGMSYLGAAGAAGGVGFTVPPGMSLPATSPAQAKTTFRVATYNIQSGKGLDKRLDLSRTASVLGGFDLIGLNEVRAGLNGTNQAAQLGQMLNMPWLFAPSETRFGRASFGNAMLCRLPVGQWYRAPLPTTRLRGLRDIVLTHVDVGGKRVVVLVTHLDVKTDHDAQLALVTDLFLSLQEPAILMGDLNTRRDNPVLAKLLATPGVVDAVGGKSEGQTADRIDWIITRGLTVGDSGVHAKGESDHPMVWAELEVK